MKSMNNLILYVDTSGRVSPVGPSRARVGAFFSYIEGMLTFTAGLTISDIKDLGCRYQQLQIGVSDV